MATRASASFLLPRRADAGKEHCGNIILQIHSQSYTVAEGKIRI